MANWPGKDAGSPVLRDDGKYEYNIKTTMPCGTNLQGTSAQDTLRSAYNKSHNNLDTHVRRHLGTCKKCPPDTRRP